MSLTLPTAYSNSSKLGNIQENWIVQLGFFNGDAHGSGEGGWDATLQADGSANLINLLGSELVQDGDNPDHRLATWTMRDSAGNSDGWDSGAPSPYSDDEIASMINTLTGNAVDAGLHYSLTFTVGVATLSLTIGGGDLTGNTADEIFVAKGNYAVGTHTITFTATADRSHLWFTANTVSAGNGTLDDVILKRSGYGTAETSIIVDDGTVFQVGDYIKIESEIIKILSISTNTLTVARGAMGTTAVGHSNNTALYWNNFTPISLADTTVDNVFYHGTITNKPSIRSSIDLASSTAKTGNISLNVINFQFKGDDFSAELFLGTRKYINREVRIYSQLNGDTTLANCLQIYQGRLIDISHDDSKISLQLTEQRPWDFITIPQTKSPNNIYEPVVYGNYTGNASSDFCANKTLFPVPQESLSSENCYYIAPRSLDNGSGNETSAHWYERGLDRFIPINNTVTSTLTDGNIELVIFPTIMERTFKFRPVRTKTDNDWSTPANAFDTNTTTFAHHTVSGSGTFTSTDQLLKLELGELTGLCTALTLTVTGSAAITDAGTGTGEHARIRFDSYGLTVDIFTFNNDGSGTGAGTDSSSSYNNTNILSNYQGNGNILDQLIIRSFYSFGSGSHAGTNRIKDVQFLTTIDLSDPDGTASARANANRQLLEDKRIYLACDGLTNSFAGGSGTADTGLEMHRDLLARFTNYDAADGSIYNWDTSFPSSGSLNVESARITTAWNTRWWALEPVELKKALQQAQEEFCFIFKWRADGSGSYWFVKDSYSSGDVTQTLNSNDIQKLQIQNTPFSALLTKMDISYEKHPAENRYISTQTSEDTTNNPRTNWNVLAKENIADIKLDMNVNKPGNTNPGGGDTNDGYADYYMNIFGDIKKIISCDIVNPAVSYNLETGDIIQFSNTAGDMPVEPFGDNWADYYMITNLQRSPGKVSITAREVG
tara:strand:- start:34 stop:2871 length:2838 start_codon:yes stop_codon:yes gene_type:complete